MLKPHKRLDLSKEEMLTLRDHIAIKCLPHLLVEMRDYGYGVIAEHAYLMADRMIEKRECKE